MENKPKPGGSQNDQGPRRSPTNQNPSREPQPYQNTGSQNDQGPRRSPTNQNPSREPQPYQNPGSQNDQGPRRSPTNQNPSREPQPYQNPGSQNDQGPRRSPTNQNTSREPQPYQKPGSQNDQGPRRSPTNQNPSREPQPYQNPGSQNYQGPRRSPTNQNPSREPQPYQKPGPQDDQQPSGSQSNRRTTSSKNNEKRISTRNWSRVSFTEEQRFNETQRRTVLWETLRDERDSPTNESARFFAECFPNIPRKDWEAIYSILSNRDSTLDKPHRALRESVSKGIFLQREMGLFSSINFLIAMAVGTGIFTFPPEMLNRTGPTDALLIWIFCGAFSLLIAITLGELVFLVTQSGGKFSYLLAAYTPINKTFGPIPAFLTLWVDSLVAGPAVVSALALSFAEEMYNPLTSILQVYGHVELTDEPEAKQAIGVAFLVFITIINFQSLKTCVIIQNMFGIVNMFLTLLMIGGGLYSLSSGPGEVDKFDSIFKNFKGETPAGIIKAAYLGMWTYEGWSHLMIISEEIKNPTRNILAALVIGLPVATVIHFGVNVAFLCVLTADEMKKNVPKFYLRFGETVFGRKNIIMHIYFTLSCISASIAKQLGSSRSCFAAGREGHLLEAFSYIHINRMVPTPAVLAQAFLSILFIIVMPLKNLIEYASFIIWTIYGFSFVALIILRATMADTYRLYKVPLFIPIVLTFMTVIVTINPIVTKDRNAFFGGIVILSLGVLVYFLFVYKSVSLFSMDQFNKLIRTYLNVAPPTALPEGYSHTSTRTLPRPSTIAEKLQSRNRYYST